MYTFLTDGSFTLQESYNFTRDSGRLCRNVSLSHSELEPLNDSIFTASVMASSEEDDPSGYDVGSLNTATIIVKAIERMLIT